MYLLVEQFWNCSFFFVEKGILELSQRFFTFGSQHVELELAALLQMLVLLLKLLQLSIFFNYFAAQIEILIVDQDQITSEQFESFSDWDKKVVA